MSLLDDDHQGPRFVTFVAGREVLLLDVALVDAPGEVVGDQDVGGQGVAVGAELEHDADALAQAVEDAVHNVLTLARDEKVHTPEQLKLALYGAQGSSQDPPAVDQDLQLFRGFLVLQELGDPGHAQLAPEVVEGSGLDVAQPHQASQHLDIFGLDLLVANAQDAVGLAPPRPGGGLVQGDDTDPAVGK